MPVRYPGSAMPWLRLAALGAATVALTVAAIIAAMPGPATGTADAERDAIAWLRRLATAERRFVEDRHVDSDGDGKGEYGCLGELAGSSRLRIDADGHVGLGLLTQPLLPGIVLRSGIADDGSYAYAVQLPARGGTWTGENDDGGTAGIPIDGERAEQHYRAFAWPLSAAAGGRAFAIDGDGTVYAHANTDGRYLDREQPVPATALDDDRAAWSPLR